MIKNLFPVPLPTAIAVKILKFAWGNFRWLPWSHVEVLAVPLCWKRSVYAGEVKRLLTRKVKWEFRQLLDRVDPFIPPSEIGIVPYEPCNKTCTWFNVNTLGFFCTGHGCRKMKYDK